MGYFVVNGCNRAKQMFVAPSGRLSPIGLLLDKRKKLVFLYQPFRIFSETIR